MNSAYNVSRQVVPASKFYLHFGFPLQTLLQYPANILLEYFYLFCKIVKHFCIQWNHIIQDMFRKTKTSTNIYLTPRLHIIRSNISFTLIRQNVIFLDFFTQHGFWIFLFPRNCSCPIFIKYTINRWIDQRYFSTGFWLSIRFWHFQSDLSEFQ